MNRTADRDTEPQCAICGHRGRRRRTLHHMTHGVSVWLCTTHSHETYLQVDAGRRFTRRLEGTWIASGSLTKRRSAALRMHNARNGRTPDGRARPGSYSWPRLRREAERRFAAGDDPRTVIEELREHHESDSARPPSVRTMRRWFIEARWKDSDTPPRRRETRRTYVVPEYMLLPPFMHPYFPQMPRSPLDRGP